MKTILSIGGHKWIAPDMVEAAKVIDMLNGFVPVNYDYRNSKMRVFVEGKGHEHAMILAELHRDAVVVKSVEAAIKLRTAEDGKKNDLADEEMAATIQARPPAV